MSNTVINWRFWHWHLQVVRWSDWRGWIRSGRSPITLMRNDWHRGRGSLRYPESMGGALQDPEWKRVEFYEGKRYAVALVALIVLAVLFL
jgi:hypothetical protein